MQTTIEPVTISGWYEHTDGTVGKYVWHAGRVEHLNTVPTWADVPSREEELEMTLESMAQI